MNLLEALAMAKANPAWGARPVSWQSAAYFYKADRDVFHLLTRGGEYVAYMSRGRDLEEMWEVVSHHDLIEEIREDRERKHSP